MLVNISDNQVKPRQRCSLSLWEDVSYSKRKSIAPLRGALPYNRNTFHQYSAPLEPKPT